MSRSSGTSSSSTTTTSCSSSSSIKKLKGVRRRKWGKWVSEIRVPGTQERLWLGTYATVEAAAVAHDVAVYCLRRPSSLEKLNFPETLSSYSVFHQQNRDLSPRSVQKVASDVAMDVDARNIAAGRTNQNTSMVGETSGDESGSKSDDGDGNVGVGTGNSDHGCGGSYWWDSEQGGDGQALNISVEDYL